MADDNLTRACAKCGGISFTKSKQCKVCVRERTLAWRAANKERLDAYSAAYRQEHRDELLAAKAADWAKNKDQVNERRRVARKADPEPVRARQRATRQRNRERVIAQQRAGYARRRDIIRARNRRWREANKEKVYAAIGRYHQDHPEVARAAKRRWKLRNPEAVRTASRAREILRGKLSPGLVAKLRALQRGRCPCCGLPLGSRFHLDHIIPLARGGEHADHNMQLMRDICNMQKSKKHPVDFMQSRGFLL